MLLNVPAYNVPFFKRFDLNYGAGLTLGMPMDWQSLIKICPDSCDKIVWTGIQTEIYYTNISLKEKVLINVQTKPFFTALISPALIYAQEIFIAPIFYYHISATEGIMPSCLPGISAYGYVSAMSWCPTQKDIPTYCSIKCYQDSP